MGEGIAVFTGPASTRLGAKVCESLGIEPARYECQRFPDGEIQMEVLESVRGRHIYVIQSTSPPVDGHLMELLLLADACRRAGAGRLTGIIPYFGYARQERRAARRSLGARVAADVIGTAGFAHLMLIDAHTPSIEGFFPMPIDHLSAVPTLARAAAAAIPANAVVVAPDLGAVKRAREFARLLKVPIAFVHKARMGGDRVQTHEMIGDVKGRAPLIVDDMLSTGATLDAAVGAVRRSGAVEPITVAVTHALLVGGARDLLARLPLARVFAGDTVPIDPPMPQVQITSLAPLVATAIRRDYSDESLADLRTTT